jgi:hypothetical protein
MGGTKTHNCFPYGACMQFKYHRLEALGEGVFFHEVIEYRCFLRKIVLTGVVKLTK